jgi:hypothetical protein
MATEAAVQKRPTQMEAWQQFATRRREEDPDAIHEAREMGHVVREQEGTE